MSTFAFARMTNDRNDAPPEPPPGPAKAVPAGDRDARVTAGAAPSVSASEPARTAAPTTGSPSVRQDRQGRTGVGSYVYATAALVPSEILAVHAVVLGFTTGSGEATAERPAEVAATVPTVITEPNVLRLAFWVLLLLSSLLYLAGRKGHWDRFDLVRAFIPPIAFATWTMLQRTTAFDAAFPDVSLAMRAFIGTVGAVITVSFASLMGGFADRKQAPTRQQDRS